MDNIGNVIGTCWKLRAACGEYRIPKQAAGVVLTLEDAERIHGALVSVAPGKDEVRVAWIRESKSELFNVEEIALVPKPHHPESGKEWFRVFDVPVYVM